ncbi:hypothetical protein LJN56_06540 [Cellulomonas sp. zg-Y908]|uniref:Uncharacterized protein n=1 Tax=Cellulomonas wangsupingiae TaxID=2968085 RepID=A0ABY5K675_9CELL|nr:hypothetical protein [Cellulomonas wangsupingiae]MCC2334264.1 hypothetical protein [Cellulomonas wangsupingiae]UUI65941.1 hypothetical protein NP075_04185 [Cellulomonas wangsupingiae]
MKRRVSWREQYWEFRPLGPDGVEGDVVLYGTQRQLRVPEEYPFSTDRAHTRPSMTVRARGVINLGNACYDAFDERGAPIGCLQYRWMESQVVHTWRVMGRGADLVGMQQNVLGGMLRVAFSRLPVVSLIPLRRGFDFRFRDTTGAERLRVECRAGSRDRYTVTTPGGSVDIRLAAGIALLLDWRGGI